MLGGGLQFKRNRNVDNRFDSAAKVRRSRNQTQSQDHLRRTQSDVTVSESPRLPEVEGAAATGDDKSVAEALCKKASEKSSPALCNLGQFLNSVTPSVTAQYPSKTTMKGWKTCDVELQPYFVLGDLWDAFKEWSAYGAGVPLILDDFEGVVQYYVPSLSGIQLYGDPSRSLVKSRQPAEDSDGDYFRDSCSDESSDCEHEVGYLNYSQRVRNYICQTKDSAVRIDRLSLRENQLSFQEDFSSDDSETGSSQGCLLFEYLERDQPYGRQPLADKVCLVLPFDCHQEYPIYRIPVGPTLKDLDACFLTFHSLHTSVTGSQSVPAPILKHPREMDDVPMISVPVFGLAHYKFKASLWVPGGGSEMNSLLKEAENWLAARRVNHPDFLFFHQR